MGMYSGERERSLDHEAACERMAAYLEKEKAALESAIARARAGDGFEAQRILGRQRDYYNLELQRLYGAEDGAPDMPKKFQPPKKWECRPEWLSSRVEGLRQRELEIREFLDAEREAVEEIRAQVQGRHLRVERFDEKQKELDELLPEIKYIESRGWEADPMVAERDELQRLLERREA